MDEEFDLPYILCGRRERSGLKTQHKKYIKYISNNVYIDYKLK